MARPALRFYTAVSAALDYAMIQAALHGRRDLVEFLLEKQPDLGFAEPFFHSTARGAARMAGNHEIVALLSAAES